MILRQKAKFGPDYCKHTFVAKTISDMSETLTLDVSKKDKIFVVQENPYFVAVVYPKENRDVKTRPGVIVPTGRMAKKRCRTCKGRDNCFHLGVFKKSEAEQISIENCESDRIAILCSLKSQMLESTNVLILAQNLESTNL